MSLIRSADPRRGAAAVEFALLLPLLIVLFIATAELVSHIRIWFRLERTAAEVANVASQFDSLTPGDVADLFDAANAIAAPYRAWTTDTDVGRARTLISVVGAPASNPNPAWTCSRGDAGLEAEVAGKASLPAGFTVPGGQSVLVVEVINAATPWSIMSRSIFFGTVGPGPIRTYAIVRPRAGALTSIGGNCP